jgi:hypothetical protein
MTLPILQERGGALGGLVQGAGQGLAQAMPSIAEMILNKQKQQQIAKAFPNLFGMTSQPQNAPNLAVQTQQQMAPELGMQQQQPNYILEDAAKASLMGQHDLANTIIKGAEFQEKRASEQREREFLPQKEYIEHAAKRNTAFLDSVDQIEKDMPTTEFSLAMMEDALHNADKWAAFKDRIAEATGFPGFKSAAGTELDSAIKSYFLGDLSSIKGGRPNIFIEKQLRDAYPRAGQDPISNQKILLGMKMKEDISRKLIEKTRELEDKYISEKKHLPSRFEQVVKKEVRPEIEEIEQKAIKTLRSLSKIEENRDAIFRSKLKSGEILMMSPDGSPFAIPKKEMDAYRAQGYIPLGKK